MAQYKKIMRIRFANSANPTNVLEDEPIKLRESQNRTTTTNSLKE